MVPEGLCVTFPFHEHYVAAPLDGLQSPEAVEERFAPGAPLEAVVARGLLKGGPVPCGHLLTIGIEVRDTDRRPTLVLLVADALLLQELDGQALSFRVVLQSAGLRGCGRFSLGRRHAYLAPVVRE
jgi:hypothetical protein